jgi:alginate O-acetyltransferase complex protein AlgI
MVFSSPVFLFLFLPLVILSYAIGGCRVRNPMLLAGSILFYAYGETRYCWVICASILVNWAIGCWLSSLSEQPKRSWAVLALGVTLNLSLLIFFKYANFLISNINSLLVWFGKEPWFWFDPIHLPLGISFFTFMAISYIYSFALCASIV